MRCSAVHAQPPQVGFALASQRIHSPDILSIKLNMLPKNIASQWATIRPILTISNEREYDLAVVRLDDLLDEVGTNERHPLYGLVDTLGTLIHAYEEKHHPMPDASGAEMLRFFLEEHGLTQSDLPEVGSQGVVSEILNGDRELNVRQIRALAKRFHVAPAVFI
jgi:HTH-type transcriptional regulator/antitoxin HigA